VAATTIVAITAISPRPLRGLKSIGIEGYAAGELKYHDNKERLGQTQENREAQASERI
jgi:hypothetical protein